jgi:hypothetical protein
MKMVTHETKVCDSCRAAYYDWKKNNPEFGGILSRVEKESLVDVESDAYESSVNEKDFLKTIVSFSPFRFNRMIQ